MNAAVLTVVASVLAATPGDALPALDVGAVAPVLEEFRRTCAREGRALWGASLCAPVLVVEPATRVYVASQRPGGGEGAGPFVGVLPADVGTANTAVTWAGTTWVQLRAPLPQDAERARALVRHEAFHALQARLGVHVAEAPNAHLDTEEGRWLLQLEWRALARALEAPGAAARRAAVQDALLFRAERHRRFLQAAAEEAALERNEGLAEDTGVVLAAPAPARRRALALENLAAARDSFVRSFAYATGPAYGALLDAARADWRQAALEGEPLAALLARALRVAPAGDAEARARAYGGDALRAQEAARAEAARRRAAQLRARLVEGPVLRLPLAQMRIEFDPGALVPLDGHGTVYPGARISDAWGTLTATGPVLVGADWTSAVVPAPAGDGPPLRGEGWALELAPGWSARAGGRPGDLELVRMNPP